MASFRYPVSAPSDLKEGQRYGLVFSLR